jgi:hypothetical protein
MEPNGTIPKFMSEGSSGLLTKLFQDRLGKKDVKVCHFGDHFLHDVHATWVFDQMLRDCGDEARWDAIAVIEEMTEYNPLVLMKGRKNRLVPHDPSVWGPSYFLDEPETKERVLNISG